MQVVLYEDRATHWAGLKLAVLSLQRFDPEATVIAHVPTATRRLRSWFHRVAPCVELRSDKPGTLSGWNVKPTLMRTHLLDGADEVVWMDCDVIVCRPITRLLAKSRPDALIVAADTRGALLHGTVDRTRAWGLEPSRPLPRVVNSGFIRATPSHLTLLSQWESMLSTPEYQRFQRAAWHERPLHMWGDQEALTALLGSDLAAWTAVKQLRAGIDMAQCDGPTGWGVWERLQSTTSGGPTLVHAMNRKPWLPPEPRTGGRRGWLRWKSLELDRVLSGYTVLARAYRDSLEEDGDWLDGIDTLPLEASSARRCGLPGLPLAAAAYPLRRRDVVEGRRVAASLRASIKS